MAKKKSTEETIKRGDLVNLAKDMNEEMGLDPAIDTKQKTAELTENILLEASDAEDGVCADDELTDESWATLKLLGVDLNAGPESEDEPEPVETAKQKKARLAKEKKEAAAAAKEEAEEEPTETAAEKKKRLAAEKKEAAAAAKKKPAAKTDAKDKKPGVKKSTSEKSKWVAFLGKLIKSGKHTRIELIDQVVDEFPGMVPASIGTHISDSKNAKYNKYEQLVIQNDKTKRLSFQK